MTSAERQIRAYCPAHKTEFEVRTAGRIVCASDPHALALDFPRESLWEYCCDCRRFWPSDLGHGGQGGAACPVCQRAIARRYLCEHCKVLSVESDDPGGRRKEYAVAPGGAVGPACPGCGVATAGVAARAHDCGASLTAFATARPTCPFCDEPLDPASRKRAAEQGGVVFPSSAEDCLKQAAGRESKVVKPDPSKGIIVKDPAGQGQFILTHDWGVPGGILYLLPRATHLESVQDFYNRYEPFYDCPRPAVGAAWVVSPAVVRKTAGGWSLVKRGELEVRDGAPPPPRPSATAQAVPVSPAPSPRATPPAAAPQEQAIAQTPRPPAQQQAAQPLPSQTEPLNPRLPQKQPAQAQAMAALSSQPAGTYADAVAGAGPSRPQSRGYRAAAIAVLALIAVTSVGLIIAAVASRDPSRGNNSNLSANGRASNDSAATSNAIAPVLPGGGATLSPTPTTYSPANPPPGMVYVPGGEFVMGGDADAYEQPPHWVVVKSFFIDEYEVTCADYAKFVAAVQHAPPPSWGGPSCPAGWERLPVTGVTWADAVAYAAWAGKRLPTEEEWEYAARGNDGRRYPWGDEWEPGAANVKGRAGQLAEVGSYRSPSPFNAYDMSGNVWEWTASDFAPYPGAPALKNLPSGKVIRGGCYTSVPGQATTTYRGVWRPSGEETYEQTGFRCVMDVEVGGTRTANAASR